MRSKLYRKFRASRYNHPTKTISGSGNSKGGLVLGHVSALQEIQQRIGRTLNVHHIEKNIGQWIFCELRGVKTS